MAEVTVKPSVTMVHSLGPVLMLTEENGQRSLIERINPLDFDILTRITANKRIRLKSSHDTLRNLTVTLGLQMTKVVFQKVQANSRLVKIHFLQKYDEFSILAGPSDAVILALRMHRPIFVEEVLFKNTEIFTEVALDPTH